MHPLWSTFLFFGVAVLVCHAPIGWVKWVKGGVVKNKDQWTKAWEKTDYLYLGLVALTLIPAGHEVSRFFSEVQLKQALNLIEGLDDTATYAHSTLGHYERLQPEMWNESVHTRLREAVEALDQGDPLLREAREFMRARSSEEAKEKLEAAIQAYDKFLSTEPPLNQKNGFFRDVELLRKFIQSKRDNVVDLLKANEDVEKREVELMFLVFAPYLLGLGLAFRVAKVTAKLVTVEEPRPIHPLQQTGPA